MFEKIETLINIIHGAAAMGPDGQDALALAREELKAMVDSMKAQKAKSTPPGSNPVPAPVPAPVPEHFD